MNFYSVLKACFTIPVAFPRVHNQGFKQVAAALTAVDFNTLLWLISLKNS